MILYNVTVRGPHIATREFHVYANDVAEAREKARVEVGALTPVTVKVRDFNGLPASDHA